MLFCREQASSDAADLPEGRALACYLKAQEKQNSDFCAVSGLQE